MAAPRDPRIILDNATIWHAATVDLPPLKAAVQALLREIEGKEP